MIKKNRIPFMGIVACLCYFITTIMLILTGTTISIVLMELATVLSTPVLLLLFMAIPIGSEPEKSIAKRLSIIFVTSCMILTSSAHFMNLAFIMPLMNSGVRIPVYFQIGQWPSALMAIDYLGWGFFVGAAFLASSVAISKKNSTLKYTLLVCGVLCLMGLVGTVLIHANCWYIAPLGYGIGTVIVCIELIALNKAQATNEHNLHLD